MTRAKGYREVLRSTSIVGGASIVSVLIGMIRIKAAAVLLGPAGVGLIGLLSNIMNVAATIAALGMGSVGARHISAAVGEDDPAALAAAKCALYWGTVVLSILGGLTVWLLRQSLAESLLGSRDFSSDIGWLGLGVVLLVLAGSQIAVLNGLRRLADMARQQIFAAAVGTVLACFALLIWRERGIVAYIVLPPFASCVFAYIFVRRLPNLSGPLIPRSKIQSELAVMVKLGFALMLAGLVMTVGQLVLRTMVQRQLGAEALGLFESAWMISMTYIGFVLRAMGTDFLPRLTSSINDHVATNRMVNEQTEIALLLAGPVVIGMAGLAPWIIEALYSENFNGAASILRLQILGDVLKIVSWPLGYVILAAGNGRQFLAAEGIAVTVLLISSWLLMPRFGIQATGIGFVAMYTVLLPYIYILARYRSGFRFVPSVSKLATGLLVLTGVISVTSNFGEIYPVIAGITAALAWGIFAIRRVSGLTGVANPLRRFRQDLK